MARNKTIKAGIEAFIPIAFKPEVDSDGDSFGKKAFNFETLKQKILKKDHDHKTNPTTNR